MRNISMESIHTLIWREEPEPDNAYTAASCHTIPPEPVLWLVAGRSPLVGHCHGYDVMEAAENPAGLLFPLPCRVILYEGVSRRPWWGSTPKT